LESFDTFCWDLLFTQNIYVIRVTSCLSFVHLNVFKTYVARVSTQYLVEYSLTREKQFWIEAASIHKRLMYCFTGYNICTSSLVSSKTLI
jgi:hypothetical protein